MILARSIPLQALHGIRKPCRWCGGASGLVDEAPKIEPANHAGRMICEGCGRQTGWVSAQALRRILREQAA